MVLSLKKLKNVRETGSEMRRLVELYNSDVEKYDSMPFPEFFRMVADLPYKADPKKLEFIQRPKYSLGQTNYRDCDDKAILIASKLYRMGWPVRFIASSSTPQKNLHHVWVMTKLPNGEERVIDATYPKNKLGQEFHHTKRKPITGWFKK